MILNNKLPRGRTIRVLNGSCNANFVISDLEGRRVKPHLLISRNRKRRMIQTIKLIVLLLNGFIFSSAFSQTTQVIRPKEIDEVLINPGIGFTTFQRFNGDELNRLNDSLNGNWTEGYPIKYQLFDGDLENKNYPQTSIAYFRVYWKFIETDKEVYNWDIIDKAISTASQRGQKLMLRIAPYGPKSNEDIPDWLRLMIGKSTNLPHNFWKVNHENEMYTYYFTQMIRKFGDRYNGNPNIESVDLSIIGFWGEGEGSELLSEDTRQRLVDAYLKSFTNTQLIMLLTDVKTNGYIVSKRDVGWRVDCLGDLGFWANSKNNYWNHMQDAYPQNIIRFGVKDAWKKAPISLEACGVLSTWLEKGYDINYIIKESLKWHISSFNAKSSPVPKQWKDKVDEWLKKMGYRFVIRRFECPKKVNPNGELKISLWLENKGVAPCYSNYPLAMRLKNGKDELIYNLDVDIRTWLPGDIIYDDTFIIPANIQKGSYTIDVAILDTHTNKPIIKLANEGIGEDGWYSITSIEILK